MIPILVLKTENKVIYHKSNLNCKTFFEEFIMFNVFTVLYQSQWIFLFFLSWTNKDEDESES